MTAGTSAPAAGCAPLYRAANPAGPRDRALSSGGGSAGAEVPAVTPQRSQEEHQREHLQQGRAAQVH
ncbi:hypothetical protein HN241_18935 [Acinetobacter baumannii]|nr:hypothetical protein [Acinetobacter baumannii]